MPYSRLEYLFNCYMSNLADAEEEREFLELVELPENKASLQILLREFISETEPTINPSPESEEAILEAIFLARPAKIFSMKRAFHWGRWIAAAVVVSIITISILFVSNRKSEKQIAKQEKKNDVAPGTEGAVLTLSNGQQIILDSAHNGALAEEGEVKIIKQGGLVSYSGSGSSGVASNTMTTANGRTYSLMLSDGSKVWLNTASSITFPTVFNGKERRVTITGEAYFKVNHNDKMPFRVIANGIEVEDIGTEFNINSYADENIVKTTLVEGSVKVSEIKNLPAGGNGSGPRIIKPGEMAQVIGNSEQGIKVLPADLNEVIAWKEGFFHFESAELPTILRQFSRWYDVEIIYEGKIPKDKFFVIISRNQTLASVLKALQASGIKFRIEEKKLIVETG